MGLISFSGTQNIGKSTLVKDFLKQWPMYSLPKRSYRDIIKEKGLKINKKTCKETQGIILDAMIDEISQYNRDGDNIVFDRCPLDNLVYTLWAYEKGDSDIDEAFVKECIGKVRNILREFSIMFFIPISKQNDIELVEKENRDIDPVYRDEIDNIFKALKTLKDNNDDGYFCHDDCGPIIEVFGSPEERIELLKLYLKEDGTFFGEDESLIYDAIGNPLNVDENNQISIEDTDDIEKLKKQIMA